MTGAIFHGFVIGFGLFLPLGPQNTSLITRGAAVHPARDLVPPLSS